LEWGGGRIHRVMMLNHFLATGHLL
jgi:hypothetical protein